MMIGEMYEGNLPFCVLGEKKRLFNMFSKRRNGGIVDLLLCLDCHCYVCNTQESSVQISGSA